MLRLGKERDELNVVVDQVGSPTYARDLARAILQIIPQLNNESVEVYHFSNEGVCAWYDFSKAIFEIAGVDCRVNAIAGSEYPTPAKRPFYSVLNKKKIIEEYILYSRDWRDSVSSLLKQQENIER